jgi:MYXO-CTERM domain-containing protein
VAASSADPGGALYNPWAQPGAAVQATPPKLKATPPAEPDPRSWPSLPQWGMGAAALLALAALLSRRRRFG